MFCLGKIMTVWGSCLDIAAAAAAEMTWMMKMKMKLMCGSEQRAFKQVI